MTVRTHISIRKARPSGFTLVELLVVVAIIGLLIAILLPALDQAKNVAKTAACLSNIRQIAVGMNTYSVDSAGYYPAVLSWPGGDHANGLSWGYTWAEALLPYVSGHDTPPEGDAAVRDATQSLKIYRCAGDPNGTVTSIPLPGGGGFNAMVGALPMSYAANGQASTSLRPGSSGNRMDGLSRPINIYTGKVYSHVMPDNDNPNTHVQWVEQPSNFWMIMDGRFVNPGYAYGHGGVGQPKPDYFNSDPQYMAVHPNNTNSWAYADGHSEAIITEETIGKGLMGLIGRGSWTKYGGD